LPTLLVSALATKASHLTRIRQKVDQLRRSDITLHQDLQKIKTARFSVERCGGLFRNTGVVQCPFGKSSWVDTIPARNLFHKESIFTVPSSPAAEPAVVHRRLPPHSERALVQGYVPRVSVLKDSWVFASGSYRFSKVCSPRAAKANANRSRPGSARYAGGATALKPGRERREKLIRAGRRAAHLRPGSFALRTHNVFTTPLLRLAHRYEQGSRRCEKSFHYHGRGGDRGDKSSGFISSAERSVTDIVREKVKRSQSGKYRRKHTAAVLWD